MFHSNIKLKLSYKLFYLPIYKLFTDLRIEEKWRYLPERSFTSLLFLITMLFFLFMHQCCCFFFFFCICIHFQTITSVIFLQPDLCLWWVTVFTLIYTVLIICHLNKRKNKCFHLSYFVLSLPEIHWWTFFF